MTRVPVFTHVQHWRRIGERCRQKHDAASHSEYSPAASFGISRFRAFLELRSRLTSRRKKRARRAARCGRASSEPEPWMMDTGVCRVRVPPLPVIERPSGFEHRSSRRRSTLSGFVSARPEVSPARRRGAIQRRRSLERYETAALPAKKARVCVSARAASGAAKDRPGRRGVLTPAVPARRVRLGPGRARLRVRTAPCRRPRRGSG